MKKQVEIRAPAGNFECLMAAIKAKADSVYFGIKGLNMRDGACRNFYLDELKNVSGSLTFTITSSGDKKFSIGIQLHPDHSEQIMDYVLNNPDLYSGRLVNKVSNIGYHKKLKKLLKKSVKHSISDEKGLILKQIREK